MSLIQIVPRLKKLLLMLSSPNDREIVNAAHLINATLRGAGADWHDLVAGLFAPTGTGAKSARDLDWHMQREFCLRHPHLLRPREHEFVVSLGNWRGRLTKKQSDWLSAIYERLQNATV